MISKAFPSGLIRVLVLALATAPLAAYAQSAFPFGRELLLDVAPMKGSKRVPSLDIGDNGGATIELWCGSMRAQLVVVADTVAGDSGRDDRAAMSGRPRPRR